jgi:hypothetical protein
MLRCMSKVCRRVRDHKRPDRYYIFTWKVLNNKIRARWKRPVKKLFVNLAASTRANAMKQC